MNYQKYVTKKLQKAGVQLNDNGPDSINVIDKRFYKKTALNGSLGFGESYADRYWECDQLDVLIDRLLNSRVGISGLVDQINKARACILNMQSRVRSNRVAKVHYDVDTRIFEWILDPYLQYTCGYWKEAKTLDEAQRAKMDLVIKKLGLKQGDTLLDIGCGWGGFAKYAAQEHGLTVKGISISESQLDYAKKLCEGLDCEFKLADYRDLAQVFPMTFDGITIIGVSEHIGHKNLETLYRVMRERIKPEGLVLQHSITHMRRRVTAEPFINKYIFPGGSIPAMSQLATALSRHFVVEDVHNFGADYDKTLMQWHQNFHEAIPDVQKIDGFNDRFCRIWSYYLLSCAGMFRARDAQLMQFVLSPRGVRGGYQRIS